MAKVILNKAEVKATAVARALPLVDKTLDQTLSLSRRYAPVRDSRPGDRRATGRLKRSLRKRGPKVLVTKVTGSVGSTLRYAAAVHDGAAPHVIRGRNRGLLSFYWERYDVWFVGPKVNHPGVSRQARTQYLYLPLVLVGTRNGFVVRRMKGDIPSPLP